HAPVRGSKCARAMSAFAKRAQRRQLIFAREHIAMQPKMRVKSKPGFEAAQICVRLLFKSIAVQFDFFGECFLYDSPLFIVENFLVRSPIGAVFRFRCDTKSAVERNV